MQLILNIEEKRFAERTFLVDPYFNDDRVYNDLNSVEIMIVDGFESTLERIQLHFRLIILMSVIEPIDYLAASITQINN